MQAEPTPPGAYAAVAAKRPAPQQHVSLPNAIPNGTIFKVMEVQKDYLRLQCAQRPDCNAYIRAGIAVMAQIPFDPDDMRLICQVGDVCYVWQYEWEKAPSGGSQINVTSFNGYVLGTDNTIGLSYALITDLHGNGTITVYVDLLPDGTEHQRYLREQQSATKFAQTNHEISDHLDTTCHNI